MRRFIIALFGLVVALGLTLTPAVFAATEPLPVPYSFLPPAIAGGMPGANAPGTNDFACKPSAAHPRPVVLVHGTAGNRSTNWQTYGPLLKNRGYCVFALTYGATVAVPYPGAFGGYASMKTSAAYLKAFVGQVLKSTGATKVDLVGHSQGTLMPNYWIKFLGGAPKVGSYISLAPLWNGTKFSSPFALLAGAFGVPESQAPLCAACVEFANGSQFMDKMRAGGVAVPGVKYVNIMTKYDELVVPYTSGRAAGMKNIVIQDFCAQDFAEHFQIAADKNASIFVLNALDPAHPKKLTCSLVLPFVGGS